MTDKRKEEAIEILGENHYGTHDWKAIKQGNNPTVSQKDARWIAETIDQILSIKGIRIECENQELPANIYNDNQYGIAQQDMLKAGWVKCLKKEEQ